VFEATDGWGPLCAFLGLACRLRRTPHAQRLGLVEARIERGVAADRLPADDRVLRRPIAG
jgi:hypothetical protein